MEKPDKDLKLENDKLSEAAVPDEAMEQVSGGSGFEEFRRYGRKEDKDSAILRVTRVRERDR